MGSVRGVLGGLTTASGGAFPGKCSSWETSTHTPRNVETPGPTRAAARFHTGPRAWTPVGEQGLCQHRRVVEWILRRWHHMGLLRCIQADFRLESGRGGPDTLRPPLHIHGGERHTWIWNDGGGRWEQPAEERTRALTVKMEDKGEELRSTPGGCYNGSLELGGLDDDDRNWCGRGGRETSPSHDGNLRRVHAASHTGHDAKQSSLLMES